MEKVFVTVYSETQAYGGAEEGGWYYMRGEPIDGVYTLCCGATREVVWDDHESGETIKDTWLESAPNNHAEDCPARGAAEKYHEQYVLGHRDEYLRSFTHRPDGVSWLDSDEDAPNEYRGEVATSGDNHVVIEGHPPESYPTERLFYE